MNQRPSTASAIARARPRARRAARSAIRRGGRRRGPCSRGRAARPAPGASRASHMPTAPPSESPQNETRSRPRASRRSSRSRAELVDRVRPRAAGERRGRAGRSGRRGSARASCGDLRVPQLVRGPERVREHERRGVVGAVEPVMQRHAVTPLARRSGRGRGRRAPGRAEVSRRVERRPDLLLGEPARARRRGAQRGRRPPGATRPATSSCAAARPTRSASTSASRSATTRPPVSVEVLAAFAPRRPRALRALPRPPPPHRRRRERAGERLPLGLPARRRRARAR